MKLENQRFTKGEELANAISHLSGALLGIIALILMLNIALKNGSFTYIFSALVFGLSLIILYFSSGINHILPQGKTKNFFFNFDQIAIFILIAGTYTPLALISFKGELGWIILGIEWGMASLGILLKIIKPTEFNNGVNYFYIISYLVMGWIIVIAVPEAVQSMTWVGFWWVIIGGLFYIVGIVFFKLEKLPYSHLVWHLFVLFGSISHFIALYFYVFQKVNSL